MVVRGVMGRAVGRAMAEADGEGVGWGGCGEAVRAVAVRVVRVR